MHDILDGSHESDWTLTAEDVRAGARPRWLQAVPSTPHLMVAVGVAASVVAVVLVGSALAGTHRHPVAAPHGRSAPMMTVPTTIPVGGGPTPTTNPGGSVPPTTRPHGGAPGVVPTTTTTVPTATTQPPTANTLAPVCAQPATAVTVTGPSQSACLQVGGTLTVTFDESGQDGGVPGSWSGQPTVGDASVLSLTSSSVSGSTMTAQLTALAPGMTSVSALFDQTCSSADTTPCTIPPLGQLALEVTVASA